MKMCSQCKEIKELADFSKRKDSVDGYKGVCRLCKNLRRRSQKRPKQLRKMHHTGVKRCIKCCCVFPMSSFKEKKVENNTCMDCVKLYAAEYREKNRDKIRESFPKEANKAYCRERYKKDPDKYRQMVYAYKKNKRETDPFFRMVNQINDSIRASLKRGVIKKDSRSREILGCDYDTAITHLIKTALKNYGFWANFKKYHIDHIIPMATASTKEDVIRLNHYTNLQLLYPEHNLSKSDNLDWDIPRGVP